MPAEGTPGLRAPRPHAPAQSPHAGGGRGCDGQGARMWGRARSDDSQDREVPTAGGRTGRGQSPGRAGPPLRPAPRGGTRDAARGSHVGSRTVSTRGRCSVDISCQGLKAQTPRDTLPRPGGAGLDPGRLPPAHAGPSRLWPRSRGTAHQRGPHRGRTQAAAKLQNSGKSQTRASGLVRPRSSPRTAFLSRFRVSYSEPPGTVSQGRDGITGCS